MEVAKGFWLFYQQQEFIDEGHLKEVIILENVILIQIKIIFPHWIGFANDSFSQSLRGFYHHSLSKAKYLPRKLKIELHFKTYDYTSIFISFQH